MASRSLSIFSDGSIKQPVTQPSGLVKYRVLDDWQSPQWGFKPRKATPDPEVNPTSPRPDNWPDTSRTRFTEDWQWFCVDLLSLSKYGVRFRDLPQRGSVSKNTERNLIVTAFKDIYAGNKFLTDGNGVDKYTNYITGEIRREDPKVQSKITAGGNHVYTMWPQEGKMVRLYSFIRKQGPPAATLDVLKDPRVQRARIIYGVNKVGDFAHLKGVPVYYPFLTEGDAYYPLKELELV